MRNFLLLCLFVAMMISCQKELDFTYHDVPSQLVIEGSLTESEATVSLSRTTPMNEPMDTTLIRDAIVNVTDLNSDAVYELTPDSIGLFKAEVSGNVGHDYMLNVVLDGKNYTSTSHLFQPVEIVDVKFEWIKMPYDMVALMTLLYTESDSKDACYWVRIYKNGEPYKWLRSHGSGAVNGILRQTTFTARQNPEPDDEDNLQKGDILKIEILPVSLEMYDYLSAIGGNSNGPRMFSGDFCLGFFLASQPAVTTIIYDPDSF